MPVAKPAHATWTDDQWSAITRGGQNMLVAAAAGSGKTAVLVERIIRKIASSEEPMDADRLLVATFTKAAAAEMKERIREALEGELVKSPDSDHLRRQLALMNRASITTLHSFCMEVIQKYFQLVPLDPGFRIANETEAELMRQDVLEEQVEELYETGGVDGRFWRLAESFGGERNDDVLFSLIQNLYDFSRSHPWPEAWLLQTAKSFEMETLEELEESEWFLAIRSDVRMELRGALDSLRQALKLAESPGGPKPYAANLQDDLALIGYLLEVADGERWEHLYHAFQGAGFGKLKPCKADETDKAVQDQVKALREQAKKQLVSIRDELFEREPAEYLRELTALAPLMQELVRIVISFGAKYAEAKTEKGLVDFADLEHFCLQILRSPDSTPDQLLPSEAAEQYRERFMEVLLDEYQDTNMVQEAIVELISREGAGNRFMVGDVKQSIYRFRLADPGLFLAKYKSFAEQETKGLRIDLARNFRSRAEIVDGVNFIFKQLMNENVAEINYDQRAELVCGATYPTGAETGYQDYAVEMLLYNRGANAADDDEDDELSDANGTSSADSLDSDEGSGAPTDSALSDLRELATAELEAELITLQIRKLLALDGGDRPFQVYDKRTKGMRSGSFRDIVILLRATQAWSPVMMERLRAAGIPAYAELSTGYFQATEVEVILSLLKIIDNPYQDIPLAGVLRSPLYAFTAEELAQIRIAGTASASGATGGQGFYGAVLQALEPDPEHTPLGDTPYRLSDMLRDRLTAFTERLDRWREEARQGSLADLIWNIYRETGYYDLVGGMPGGIQRQANLRALYDRSRQYEATSFRGLFRFLRFIERMQDGGGDLGAARALGEQEDVVRIMSIHKSKGLEFPVVFVAGLSKAFNQSDLKSNFLLHKKLGFGPKFVDTALRLSYPTLPNLAIKRSMRMEMLAEEMRVLYVALTRPKEKLYLVSAVKDLEKQMAKWSAAMEATDWSLPEPMLARARSYLDWLGPALMRHPASITLKQEWGLAVHTPVLMAEEPSRFRIHVLSGGIQADLEAAAGSEGEGEREVLLSYLQQAVPLQKVSETEDKLESQVSSRLNWQYPDAEATGYFTKTTVTEMKRLKTWMPSEEEAEALPVGPAAASNSESAQSSWIRRPRFLEARKLTPAERGIAYHAVMQQLPLSADIDHEVILNEIAAMVEREQLTEEQSNVIDAAVVSDFFRSPLGQALCRSPRVQREIPFSRILEARRVYPDAIDTSSANENILIQGVIDCVFEKEDGGLVLLDYKTDSLHGGDGQAASERYQVQLDLYAEAVEQIWKRPVTEMYLFFFDGARIVEMSKSSDGSGAV
ncbi:ATP-dependent helicase [Paenibacillus swuensis]|uniref:ATP-dependent helicase/nuclease subunit A n=1 Tax=Paenibacillus swuensis TaxID=1178515 RepID=A0A172TPK0_9BACL|nr:ATP-dependent helicase [Paenibacillus swuensis]